MKENSKEKEQSEYVEDETTIYEVDLECLKGLSLIHISGYGRKNYIHVCKRNDNGRYRSTPERTL